MCRRRMYCLPLCPACVQPLCRPKLQHSRSDAVSSQTLSRREEGRHVQGLIGIVSCVSVCLDDTYPFVIDSRKPAFACRWQIYALLIKPLKPVFPVRTGCFNFDGSRVRPMIVDRLGYVTLRMAVRERIACCCSPASRHTTIS